MDGKEHQDIVVFNSKVEKQIRERYGDAVEEILNQRYA